MEEVKEQAMSWIQSKLSFIGVINELSIDSTQRELLLQTIQDVMKNIDISEKPSLLTIATQLGRAIAELVAVAEKVGGAGQTKRQFVIAAAMAVYLYIDRGPSGDLNRIKIPWVPKFIERWLEEKLLPVIISVAIEAVLRKM